MTCSDCTACNKDIGTQQLFVGNRAPCSTAANLPPEIWYHVLDQALHMLLPQSTTPRTYMTFIFPLLITCHAFHNHCRPQTYPHLRKHRLLQLFAKWKAAHSREVHFYHHPLRTHVRYALPDRVGNPPGEEYEALYSFIKRAYLFGCDSVCGTVIPVEGGVDGAGTVNNNNNIAAQAAAAAAHPNTPGHFQQHGHMPHQAQPNVAQTTPQQAGDGGGQGWKNHALQWHVANPTFAAEGTIELYRDVVEEYRRTICGPPKTDWVYELEQTLSRPRQQREQKQRLRVQQQYCRHELPSPALPSPPLSTGYEAVLPETAPNDSLATETEWMNRRIADIVGVRPSEHADDDNHYQIISDDDFEDGGELEEDDEEEEELDTDEDETETGIESSSSLVGDEPVEPMEDQLSSNSSTSDESMMDREESEMLNVIEAKGGLRRRDSGHGQSTSEMDVDDEDEEEEEEEEEVNEYDDGMQSLDEEMELLRRRQEILYALRQQRRQIQQQQRQQRRYSNNDGQQQHTRGEDTSAAAYPTALRRRRSKSQSALEKRQRGRAANAGTDTENMIMDMALDRPLNTMAPLSVLNPLPPLPPPLSSSSPSSSSMSTFADTSSVPSSRPLKSSTNGSRKRPIRRGHGIGSTSASASSSGSERNSDSSRSSSRRTSPRRQQQQYHHHHHYQPDTHPTMSATTELASQGEPLPSPTLHSSSTRTVSQQHAMVEGPHHYHQSYPSETAPPTVSSANLNELHHHHQLPPLPPQQLDEFDLHNLGFDLASACANTFASDLAFVLARVPGLGAHFHRFEQLSTLKLHVGWAKHAQSRGGNDVFVMSCSRLIALLAPLANTPLVSERSA